MCRWIPEVFKSITSRGGGGGGRVSEQAMSMANLINRWVIVNLSHLRPSYHVNIHRWQVSFFFVFISRVSYNMRCIFFVFSLFWIYYINSLKRVKKMYDRFNSDRRKWNFVARPPTWRMYCICIYLFNISLHIIFIFIYVFYPVVSPRRNDPSNEGTKNYFVRFFSLEFL